MQVGMITDFNLSMNKTSVGRGIIATTDQMAGGQSIVDLSQLNRNDKNQALAVKGEVKSSFIFPWSQCVLCLCSCF